LLQQPDDAHSFAKECVPPNDCYNTLTNVTTISTAYEYAHKMHSVHIRKEGDTGEHDLSLQFCTLHFIIKYFEFSDHFNTDIASGNLLIAKKVFMFISRIYFSSAFSLNYNLFTSICLLWSLSEMKVVIQQMHAG